MLNAPDVAPSPPGAIVPVAPTAFTPDPGSAVTQLDPPSVDHCGASPVPDGTDNDPGTNDWFAPIASVSFTVAGAPVVFA